MPKVKIIRAAFREIQKLPPFALQSVYKILHRLSQGDRRHTKSLQGYENLQRTRVGNVRVIWERTDTDSIVVIKAGQRGDVYDKAFDSLDRNAPRAVEELLSPQGIPLPDNPTYEWNQEEDDDAWYKFVYGGYQYSPVLTQYQREVLSELKQQWRAVSNKTWLVQSAPGTGKTVCAALLACEIHQQYGSNTTFIVPEALLRDIAEYSEVKRILQSQQEGFRLCTFRDWLRIIAANLYDRLLEPEKELQILQGAATRARVADLLRSSQEKISQSDVLLYQAYVLDQENQKQEKNTLYRSYENRIRSLKRIGRKFWDRELSESNLFNHLCRLDVANQLQSNPPSPPNNAERTIFILDEAQDFLLAELQALKGLREAWDGLGHPTYLWLLGDLNQRIQPTGFLWWQLKLGEPLPLLRNYRNSRRILEFANQFLKIARENNHKSGGRHREIPEPANPEYAVEVGEPVRLLECSSPHEALQFLNLLTQASWQGSDERRFLKESANRVKVLWPYPDQQYCNSSSIEILNAEKAKGREFEACVAFRIFQGGTPSPSLEESFRWYTMLTRPRSRLLVVATTADLERLKLDGHNYFQNCECIDSKEAVSWIAEVASGVDFTQFRDDVKNIKEQLLLACECGCPYWDTYLALQVARVEGNSLYQWERDAISCLKQHSVEDLQAELNQTKSISLRCLLLRSMDCSWQALEEASQLRKSDGGEYERLLESIAKDLKNKNLPYEAARVLARLGQPWPDYPFSEIAQESGSLVSLLCKGMLSRPFPNV